MLRKALTQKSIDHSDTGQFSFSFFCDKCGKEWTSPPQPFSGEGSPAVENEKAFELLWASEHHAAFDEANLEARLRFNHCQVCGRRVCEDCFIFVEGERDGICKDCREKNEQ
jgi:hypothetical protein